MEILDKKRCTAIKADGARCRTFAVSQAKGGRGLCIFHDFELNKNLTQAAEQPLNDAEMGLILSRQLRRLNLSAKRNIETAKEMRSLCEMIGQLRGGVKTSEEVCKEETGTSLEDRIAKAKLEHS